MNEPTPPPDPGDIPSGFFHPLSLLGGTWFALGILLDWPEGALLLAAGVAMLAIGSGAAD